MRLSYPASFLKFVLVGFAFVAVPLIVTSVVAFLSLRDLSGRSVLAISRATAITRDSRALGEQLTALERITRQQFVLRDPEGLEAYAVRRRLFLAAADRLLGSASTEAVSLGIANIQNQEERVWLLLNTSEVAPEQAQEGLQSFSSMVATAADVVRLADEQIEADIAALREQTNGARRNLLLQLWTLIPAGLVLSAGMALLIGRPIRQIEDGILGLGEGQLDQPIKVEGPRDLVSLGEQLDWLRLRLREADSQKTRFLHHVSHELKTPLTALHEGTQLLNDDATGTLNPDQQEIVKILQSNCTRLRRLIENLLDYSNIRFHRQALRTDEVDLDELFSEVVDDQRLPLAARDLHLDQVSSGLRINADREKLRIVVDNLLSNAVKYAPEGSRIRLEARHSGAYTEISVADNGPGVPDNVAPRMFEAFVQGPAPEGSPVKGTGLGLSIVREFVTAHGGEVKLERNQPRGTRAVVRLPRQAGEAT